MIKTEKDPLKAFLKTLVSDIETAREGASSYDYNEQVTVAIYEAQKAIEIYFSDGSCGCIYYQSKYKKHD